MQRLSLCIIQNYKICIWSSPTDFHTTHHSSCVVIIRYFKSLFSRQKKVLTALDLLNNTYKTRRSNQAKKAEFSNIALNSGHKIPSTWRLGWGVQRNLFTKTTKALWTAVESVYFSRVLCSVSWTFTSLVLELAVSTVIDLVSLCLSVHQPLLIDLPTYRCPLNK